jgi:hypothetical protein
MYRIRDFDLEILKGESTQCNTFIMNLQKAGFQFEVCTEMAQYMVNGGVL